MAGSACSPSSVIDFLSHARALLDPDLVHAASQAKGQETAAAVVVTDMMTTTTTALSG
jgi:hypothetical protein